MQWIKINSKHDQSLIMKHCERWVDNKITRFLYECKSPPLGDYVLSNDLYHNTFAANLPLKNQTSMHLFGSKWSTFQKQYLDKFAIWFSVFKSPECSQFHGCQVYWSDSHHSKVNTLRLNFRVILLVMICVVKWTWIIYTLLK